MKWRRGKTYISISENADTNCTDMVSHSASPGPDSFGPSFSFFFVSVSLMVAIGVIILTDCLSNPDLDTSLFFSLLARVRDSELGDFFTSSRVLVIGCETEIEGVVTRSVFALSAVRSPALSEKKKRTRRSEGRKDARKRERRRGRDEAYV